MFETEPLNPIEKEICQVEKELHDTINKLSELHSKMPLHEVENYAFKTPTGEISLKEMFGGHQEMILIHNMGKSCPYCTLWADGFQGMYGHFRNRAAFVMVNSDDPNVQREFAESRGWQFPMYSAKGNSFTKDMGFAGEEGDYLPGVSTFVLKDGKIMRKTRAAFGPGDLYCSIWHMLNLLPNGVGNWQPKFSY